MTPRRIALFPGQGSQHVGMAKELHENFKLVRELFEEVSDAIHQDLRKICFDGPDSELTLTENTQPCLLTTSVAAFRVAQAELGYTPDAVAGHSLGEYSALVAAGAFPLATAARWVKARGRAMQAAVPAGEGTMAAVLGLEDAQVEMVCRLATENALANRASGKTEDLSVEAVVEPANFNSPGQVVIAGSKDAIAEAIALIKSGTPVSGGKALPLSVSAPFHCRLMRPARDKMAELFSLAAANEKPRNLSFAYVPNRTGRPSRELGLIFELLIEQVDHPVLWRQSILSLLEAPQGAPGANEATSISAVEFGPGKVLAGLMKRIAQPVGKTCPVLSVGDKAGIVSLETFIKTTAKAAAQGEVTS